MQTKKGNSDFLKKGIRSGVKRKVKTEETNMKKEKRKERGARKKEEAYFWHSTI